MEQLKFTANRFKNTAATENSNKQGQHENSQLLANNNENALKTHSQAPLLDTPHYSLSNHYWKLPELEDGESVVSFEAATDSIAILITSSRVLIYDYQSFEKRPYTFQFRYNSNDYNIPPLCSLLPNPLNALKPDLVIIEPISGALHFFEAIKLAPSLRLLQNKLQDKISLHNAEFLTRMQLFEDNCLLVTTSQKRVIYVTFKDQFGDLSINYFQVYNNRPLISFMLSKTYSIKEYANSSHIVSVKCADVSPVMKTLIVLESTGHVTFIDHLKTSTTFTTKSSFNLDLILKGSNLKFMDFQFVLQKNIGIFLVLDPETNSLFNAYFDFCDEKSDPVNLYSSVISSIPKSESIVSPKLFLLEGENSLLTQNNNRLIVSSLNHSKLPHAWTEVIILKQSVHIYSAVRIESLSNTIVLATDKGLILFELKSLGDSSNTQAYVKEHLLQYLKFSQSSSPVVFSLKETLLPITQDDIRNVLNQVLDELLEDNSNAISTDLSVDENLFQRVEMVKKTVVYVSQNYEINEDEKMRVKLLDTCELLSLTRKFFELIIDRDLFEVVSTILKEMKFYGKIDYYFQKNPKNILLLISEYLKLSKNVGNEVQLKNLTSLLSDLFVDALIKLDDDIKEYLNNSGISTIFIDHYDLISNIDDVTRMVYNLKLTEEEMIFNYGEILIGLCCFLYYTTNEIIAYLNLHNTSNAYDDHLAKYSKLLDSHKDKWIHSFIVLKKQNDIIPLVNKYDDFQSLSALLESKREIIQNLYNTQEISDIEFANLSADIEIEFDEYFDQYEYTFAKSLFLHYIHCNKIDILLTCFEKHSDLLDKFLSSDIKYYDFAWIQDIKLQRFDSVSNDMSLYLSERLNNPIKAKKIQTSIAKLATLCGTQDDELRCTRLKGYDCSLSLLSIQQYVYFQLKNLGLFRKDFDTTSLFKTPYLTQNNFCYLPTEVQNTFQNLSKNISVSVSEIIDFISLASFPTSTSLAQLSLGMNQCDTEVEGIAQDFPLNEDDIMENDGSKSLANEFIITTYIKLFSFLKNYVPLKYKSNLLETVDADGPTLEKKAWAKILLRRLILRKDLTSLINTVLPLVQAEGDSINLSPENLICTPEELRGIGIKNTDACLDFEKENELLRRHQLNAEM